MSCFHCDGTGILEGTRICYHCRKEELSTCEFCDPIKGEHELGCTDHPGNAPGFIGPSYEELRTQLATTQAKLEEVEAERDNAKAFGERIDAACATYQSEAKAFRRDLQQAESDRATLLEALKEVSDIICGGAPVMWADASRLEEVSEWEGKLKDWIDKQAIQQVKG